MKDNMDDLLKKALTPYIEPGDNLNSKIYEANNNGKVVKKKNRIRMIKAASLVICILSVGTVSVYAAVNKMGISEYFHRRNMNYPKQAVKNLTKDNIEQQAVGDSLVEFKVREVMADVNNMVIQIEATPKDPEHYILIDDDEMGTIRKDTNKKPLYTRIYGETEQEGYTWDDFKENDGSIVYMLFYNEGTFREGNVLKFNVMYRKEQKVDSEFTQFELNYRITSLDKAEKITYEPQMDAGWMKDVLKAKIKQVSVYKSEASLKVVTDTWIKGDKGEEDVDIWYKILNEDGEELKSLVGGKGNFIKDGLYRTEEVCEYTKLSDTLTIVVINWWNNSEYGRFTVKCGK